ncbi:MULTISPECIES: hypothetical protein [unclassified Lysobacter]|uniref:hypothetical protein n=1 Tax=unclassified Lysobacter TaxID=2635362 RepID=UPI001BEAB860|nr:MULTISPECIES: hypothetical protein [unclassified Lysobacter]MBT2749340.1 hypothetical protein [Lysobacter sp. ISL-42]MBT2750885.1 hypothetical protein [Lysobacter sp. ISL-50]MBT2777952.1 hypothetical protein [Lysobacter sp. ISL-54]MBT2783990.1 hypothetical protein [Lysobacter sp. ISL-52]
MATKHSPARRDPAASLRRLSLWFYVLAGLDVAAAVMFGQFARSIRDSYATAALAAEPGQLGNLAIALCTTMLAVNAVFALLHLATALSLRRRRSRALCIGVSVLSCLLFPFGTVTGAYALALLRATPIKALFASAR